MRILLVPRIETINGTGSLTITPMLFVREVVRNNPNDFFYLAVHENFTNPSWMKMYGMTDQEIERVQLIALPSSVVGSVDIRTYQRRLEYVAGHALFDKIRPFDESGKYIDVVVTECLHSIPYIKSIMQGFYSRGYVTETPVVAWSYWNPSGTWKVVFNDYDAEASNWGMLLADHVIFGANNHRDEVLADLRKFCNPATISRVLSNSSTHVCGVDVDHIKYRTEPLDKNCVVGLWSGYLTQDYTVCVPPLLNAYKSNKIDKLILQSIDVKKLKDEPPELEALRKSDRIKVLNILPHDEYLQLVSTADIFVAHEGPSGKGLRQYGMRWAELIAGGCIPVVSKYVADNLLWPNYPFVATSNFNDVVIAAATFARKPDAKEFRLKLRAWAESNGNAVIQNKKIYADVKKVFLRSLSQHKAGPMGERLKTYLQDKNTVTHEDLVNFIGKAFFGNNSDSMFSENFLRWSVLQLGWEDVGKEKPYYRKIV